MRVTQAAFFTDLIRMCEDAYRAGWHECHGGNLSYRLSAEDVAAVSEELSRNGEWRPVGIGVPGLAGDVLLVTAAGENYSIIDSTDYNNFQAILGEYEKLLQNGQNTSEVSATLNDYMTDMRAMLSGRFDSAGALLPQTASKGR